MIDISSAFNQQPIKFGPFANDINLVLGVIELNISSSDKKISLFSIYLIITFFSFASTNHGKTLEACSNVYNNISSPSFNICIIP